MNLKIVFILLALALATISALICVLLTRGEKPMSCESQTPRSQKEKPRGFSLVFADLTPEEMVQVVKYLQENLGVPLVDASQANPSDNFIYYIDVQLPAKTEVLQFLDGGGSYPPRQALAVLYFGNQADPNITEYVVGPLPIPTTHHDITMEKYGEKLPYYRRPMLAVEYKEIVGFLRETVFPMAPTFMSQTFNYDRTNLAAMTSAPRGFQSTDRNTWFVLFQNVSGFFLHPVGLEVLVDHSSLDLSQWRNGAIEAKVQATGYMSSSFLYGDGLEYGHKVGEHTLGTLHTHSMNYKVDLDVGGTKNSLVTHDMAFETVQAPWSPEHHIERPRLIKKVLDKEDKAAFRLDSKMPRYVYFAANSENKWGHEQGYRFQIISFPGDHLPETSTMERAISWGRYKLAVTKRKENEPTSSSIYNQNDPWTPTVAFADFINNETIINEDLVAWITIGFLHIPHAEDVPNTVTVGNAVGFLLRPYNYYDEDPSIYSPDSVFFTSEQDFGSCEVNPIACLSKTASCLPNLPPFTYSGFQNMTRL